MRGIITFIVLVGLFSIALLIAVPTLDTIVPTVQAFDLNGMGGTVTNIHAAIVKYSVPVFLFSVLAWAVFWILRTERQEVR